MNKIEILLQGESIADIELITLAPGAKYAKLLDEAAERRGDKKKDEAYLVFREDEDEPVDPKEKIGPNEPGRPHRIQVHRCRRIEVSTSYNGETKTALFSPAVTIGTAKRRIAQGLFRMEPTDAAEHVLQIAGTAERPEPDTHLGALVVHGRCKIAFDLVPLTRVEG